MRVAFKQAMGAAALPKWRAMEVDETCCNVYSEIFGATRFNGVRPQERWQYATGPDEMWRCSIDKLPDAAFEGADLWLLSPPCQPFTRTGKKQDVEDPRCAALLRLMEALPRLSKPPRAIFMENVPEFMGSRAHSMWGRTLARCGRTAGLTYEVQEHLLNPVDFGYPNTRRRYYLTAVCPTGAASSSGAAGAGAGGGVSPTAGASAERPLARPISEFCQSRPLGEDLRIPQELLARAEKEHWQLDVATAGTRVTKTFTAGYGKREYEHEGLSKAGPLLLTEADGWTPSREHWPRFRNLPSTDWNRVRYFAPQEVMALHGYPAGWALPGWLTTRQQWRLIGNSINVDLVTRLLQGLLARVS